MSVRTTQEPTSSLKSKYEIPNLPLNQDLETKEILIKINEASRALAELKGVASSMPNQEILISTLSLQEAKDSSAIENIITTHDDLYQSDSFTQHFKTPAAKEVHMYAKALRLGFLDVKKKGILTNTLIKETQAILEGNTAGFRSQGGTALKNEQTSEIVYIPPQELEKIEIHMRNLELFTNENSLSELDPLIKMAIIHHQFESIHPFFDGNGRTGRILNILYLVKENLLDTPVLYLSRYINKNKAMYYQLLQDVRDNGSWEKWVLFMLEGVKETSYQTIRLIEGVKKLMQDYKHRIRNETSIYSQDLLNLIFSHPYTKISHVEIGLNVSRPTAARYLENLVQIGLMNKVKIGRDNYYINKSLMLLLINSHNI